MRMLRWICGATKNDKIRNEYVRGSVKVAPVTKKITEKRLKWFEHVKRRDQGHILRRMLDIPVPGKRWRGRLKPGGNTGVKRYGKGWVEGEGRTGQDRVE